MKIFKRTLLLLAFIIFMGIGKLLMEGNDYPNPYLVTFMVIALALFGIMLVLIKKL